MMSTPKPPGEGLAPSGTAGEEGETDAITPRSVPTRDSRPTLFPKTLEGTSHNPLLFLVQKYSSYLLRLLKETDPSSREVTAETISRSMDSLEKSLEGETGGGEEGEENERAVRGLRRGIMVARGRMGEKREKKRGRKEGVTSVSSSPPPPSSSPPSPSPPSSSLTSPPPPSPTPKKKPGRSILFGVSMGAVVIAYCFSGNYVFTSLFFLTALLAQLEYFRSVVRASHSPARLVSCLSCFFSFTTALLTPSLHQFVVPSASTLSMVYLLTSKKKTSTIADISSTLMGIVYLGHLPSFWIRTRTHGRFEPTRIASAAAPVLAAFGKKAKDLPKWLPATVHLPVTAGAVFTCWSFICIAFA